MSPGLNALVVYLRPTARPSLLTSLAELGLFVHEVTGEQLPAVLACPSLAPDVVAVVGESRSEDIRMLREISNRLTPAVLALWPEGEDTSEAQASGAMAVASDSRPSAVSAAMTPVAHFARSLRDTRRTDEGVAPAIFGSLTLKRRPDRLESAHGMMKLSKAEYAVLSTLAASLGRPVHAYDLEIAARSVAHPTADADGDWSVGPTIARIRRKATRLGGQAVHLSNVRGFGYILTG